MSGAGKRWTVYDRNGYPIYLTEERWQHITEQTNHPEVADFEERLKTAIQKSRRRQEPLNPRKYRYTFQFDDLPEDTNQLVAIVIFGFDVNEKGEMRPNNFIATAFLKHLRSKGGRE